MSDSITKYHERLDDVQYELNLLVNKLLNKDFKAQEWILDSLLTKKLTHVHVGDNYHLTFNGTVLVVKNVSIVTTGDCKLGEFIFYKVLT